METIITLLIFAAIALLTQWLQRKQQKEAEPPETDLLQPPPAQKPGSHPGPKALDWEEELRRLLQGEEPRPRPAPPPVQPQPKPPQAPPPVPKPARPPPVEAAPPEVAHALPETVAPVRPSKPEEHARSLQRQVDEYLRTYAQPARPERPRPAPAPTSVQAPEVVRSAAAPELAQAHARLRSAPLVEAEHVKAMLRDRSSARSAFLAGVILSPPKALQGFSRPEVLP